MPTFINKLQVWKFTLWGPEVPQRRMKWSLQLEAQALCGLPDVVLNRVIGEPRRVWEQHGLCYFGTACWMKRYFTGIIL